MKHTIIFLLLTVLLLSLTGCRSNFMEPEAMQEFLDGVVENIGDSQITDDNDLIGARLLADDDSYVGEYTAECSHILPDIIALYESGEGQREFQEWKPQREAEAADRKAGKPAKA